MREQRSREFRVGMVVICGLLIVILGTIWAKDFRINPQAIIVRCAFPNSGGLRPGDPVTVNGVRRGRVESVDLLERTVLVRASLQSSVRLFADAHARISMTDLMGGYKLEILPGNALEPLSPGDEAPPIPGELPVGIPDLLNEALSAKTKVDTILDALHANLISLESLLRSDKLQMPLHNGVRNLDQISTGLAKLVRENEDMIGKTVTSLHESSRQLQMLMERNSRPLETSLQRLNSSIERIDSLTVSLQDIGARLQDGRGTLSKLIYSDQMYRDLQRAVGQLDSTASDLRSHLGRYLNGVDIKLINLIDF